MSSILTAEDFCAWLRGYLSGVTGRDELDAFEANTIRNTLNAIGAAAPQFEVHTKEALRTALERITAAFKGLRPLPLVLDAMAAGLIRDAEAALALDSAQAVTDCDTKLRLFLSILASAGGKTSGNDDPWNWINYFCNDAEPTDTFNQAGQRKLIWVGHDGYDNSEVSITDSGKAFIAEGLSVPSADCGGGK